MHSSFHYPMPSDMRTDPSGARVLSLAAMGAGCIVLAFLLRHHPSAVRDAMTLALGAEGRALVEHLLAAFGLLLHMLLVAPAPCWLDRAWARLCRTRAAPGRGAGRLARHAGLVVSAVYLCGSVVHELGQAWVSVYGAPAREFVQYGQLLADAAGAWLAVRIARGGARRR